VYVAPTENVSPNRMFVSSQGVAEIFAEIFILFSFSVLRHTKKRQDPGGGIWPPGVKWAPRGEDSLFTPTLF
jgi:hypothetical protein